MMSGGMHEIGIEGFAGPADIRPMPDQYPAEQPADVSPAPDAPADAGEDG